jgi:hypothetical protein
VAKSSCGGSPVHLHHEIEKRKKKKRNHAYNVMSSDFFKFFGVFFETKSFGKYSRNYFSIVNLIEISFSEFFSKFYDTELQKKKKPML